VLAGEASADTRRLIEDHARRHPDFARTMAEAGRLTVDVGTAPFLKTERFSWGFQGPTLAHRAVAALATGAWVGYALMWRRLRIGGL
jgi:hypothetical protein